MFRTASGVLLLTQLLSVAGSPVCHDDTSLLQVDHLTAVHRHEQDEQHRYLADVTQRYEAAAKHSASPPAVPLPWPPGNNSFVSTDGLMCTEGDPRAVESALALKKAGMEGRLYDNVTVKQGGCVARGYSVDLGQDPCAGPGIGFFVEHQPAELDYSNRVIDLVISVGSTFGMDANTSGLVYQCTCHPLSQQRRLRGSQCLKLNNMTAAWLHYDPSSGVPMTCSEGPITTATWSLAVLKSSKQLPMHLHDTVKVANCTALGFPYQFSPVDHCFPPMSMYTRTNAGINDTGLILSAVVEQELFKGAADAFYQREGMNTQVLSSLQIPGCHCLNGSSVLTMINAAGPYCQYSGAVPPVRDWWHSAVELR